MKYYESPAFGEFCRRVYGSDMKQQGVLQSTKWQYFP